VASYQYSLDNGPFSAETPKATQIVLTGLPDGAHTVAVLGRDAAGNQQPADAPTTASWRIKTIPPVLTLNPVSSPTGGKSQTIGGTVELGTVPSVTVNTTATVGPVTIIGGAGIATWSCTISGLAAGANTVTVRALDFVFNLTTVIGTITVILPDGNFKGTGVPDTSDVFKALRMSVGLEQPSALDMLHGDVAPLVGGVPAPNNKIDIADALIILKKVVGLINF
jgi:hypothetical protein